MEQNQPISVRKQIRQQSIGYVMAAFGFVAGLAWNEAIKGGIEALFPFGTGGMIIKFVYAIVVTLVLVLASVWLSRFKDEPSK